jgi:hypothetical protein
MIALPITSAVAAGLAIIMLPLTLLISMRRKSLGNVVFGDGDDKVLRRRIRAFGNFVEYAPFCLLLLALMELQGAPSTWLWAVGGLLAAGRAVHAIGMLFVESPAPRGVGMIATYAAVLIPAVWFVLNLRG